MMMIMKLSFLYKKEGDRMKKIMYKFLSILMIIVLLFFFMISPASEAKLKLKEGQLYYSGTQEAEYVVEKGPWEKIVSALKNIASFLYGLMALGIRGVFLGWVQIVEMLLSNVLSLGEGFEDINANETMQYSQDNVTTETIIFNRVPILDANIFK